MFRIENLHVSYGDIQVLWGISLEVAEGKIVALLGSNGAGKSTTLKTVMGMMPASQGKVYFRGEDISRKASHEIVNSGLFLVPEWRGTFATLSVLENLELGAFPARARQAKEKTLKRVFEIFPKLHERRNQKAGTLSGGERQMLALGRALMARPAMLILDEPSLGLAPLIVENTFKLIQRLKEEEGLTVLIVEQNAALALGIADYAFIFENGRVVGEGIPKQLLSQKRIQEAYLGL